MNAILRLTDIAVEGSNEDYATLRIILENVGKTPIPAGNLNAKCVSTERAEEFAAWPCTQALGPGEKVKLSLLLKGSLKAVDVIGYEPSEGSTNIRVVGLLSWWRSPWSLKAA